MNTSKKFLQLTKHSLLPFFMAIFPALFHYGNNATILIYPSLLRMMALNALIAIIIYGLILTLKKQVVESANAAFIFLIFFNTYGILYDYLLKLDIFRIEHFTLFPLFMLFAIYASWLISKPKTEHSFSFWNSLTFIVGMLILFNGIKIIPTEIKKIADQPLMTLTPVSQNSSAQGYPDIYYIILDEFAGFEPMREYWHNRKVDDFVRFLKSKGFFIAEQSHGSSIYTLHQMASRLNLKEYPCCGQQYYESYYDPLANSEVMRYLKSKGYSTVVLSELSRYFPAVHPFLVDYSFEYQHNVPVDLGVLFDDFGILIADNSMLRVFSKIYVNKSPNIARHINMIRYTLNKITDMPEVASPKFVYAHLMLPHNPFVFDEKGNVIDPEFYTNWNYYLGHYNYSMQVAQQMVENILSKADPNRPPIIILQSDHGARNLSGPNTINLLNYPKKYNTHIMFTLYMPGYDTSGLPQDINPINTFPIVFNYLFNANIPLK